MAQNKKLNQNYTNLNDLVVPDNWMEITGPFYHIKTENKETIGPFHSHDISQLLEVTNLPDATLIKDAKNTSGWTPLYSHPVFQRRKPSLLTQITNVQAEKFYYLKNGSPVGPVTPTEMEILISDKNIISTDAVSIDEGKTWLKLYQVPGFDQRSYSASELPIIPDKNEEEIDPTSLNEENESTQIANLVYLESRKSKIKETVSDQTHTETKSSSKSGLLIISAIIIIALIGYLSQSKLTTVDKQKTAKEMKKAKKSIKKEQKTKSRATKAIRVPASPARKAIKKPARRAQKLKTRTPKSFISTPIYKDRKKMKDNALEEDSYYDDGEGDIENDAVRKAISRDTLYPVNGEELEPELIEDDIYKDEEDNLDSAENEISSAEDVWGDETPNGKNTKDPFDEEY